MSGRDCLKALGVLCVLLPFAGCTNTQVGSITVSPTSETLAVGATLQFTATGIIGHGSHPATSENVTDLVTWTSSTPSVATVSSTGLATAVGAGSTTISASFGQGITASAVVTVTGAGPGGGGGTLVSLSLIPSTQSVNSPTQTAQFLAIGTTSSGTTENLTNSVAWSSSDNGVATISSSGLATATGQGTATITAIATISGNAVITGSASFTVSGAISEQYTALTIIPNNESLSASGQTGQLIALGTLGSNGLQTDVTNSPQITWRSSIPSIATVSTGGLAKGVSVGTTTVTAELTNPDGSIVSGTTTINVNLTPAPEPLLSLTVIPSTITVGNLQDTGQFLAIGTFSTSPTVRDLTNQVTWLTSAPNVFPVTTNNSTSQGNQNAGLVSAFGSGGAVIIAEYTNPDPTDPTIQTATATFNCPLVLPNPPITPGSCYEGSQATSLLSTLTIYNEGLNTTNWLVEGPSATGTPDVVHCGPGWTGSGGSVCTATYPVPVTIDPANVCLSEGTCSCTAQLQSAGACVVLKGSGGSFGGWSYNCIPSDSTGTLLPSGTAWTAAGPNYCFVPMMVPVELTGGTIELVPTNETVGAIFN